MKGVLPINRPLPRPSSSWSMLKPCPKSCHFSRNGPEPVRLIYTLVPIQLIKPKFTIELPHDPPQAV